MKTTIDTNSKTKDIIEYFEKLGFIHELKETESGDLRYNKLTTDTPMQRTFSFHYEMGYVVFYNKNGRVAVLEPDKNPYNIEISNNCLRFESQNALVLLKLEWVEE